MGKMLWKPSEERINQANITRFINFVNERYSLHLENYWQLYEWSIEHIPDFWKSMWEFADIKASKEYDEVVINLDKFPPDTKWFIGAKLNFAENLLKHKDDHVAFIFHGETQKTAKMTYAELNDQVSRLAKSLRELGIKPGDRIGSYMPNIIETAVAMLATTSIGATWASCGAELGPSAVLDRLGQIEPKVLFVVDGYFYKGKTFEMLPKAEQVTKGISSLKKVIVVSYTADKPDIRNISKAIHYEEFLSTEKELKMEFEQLPFDHPGFIMFSSGTTGKPKCMVQSAGGVLINHLKELLLHTDLTRNSSMFYISSPSWMMHNWMLSSLAVGTTIVLFDGNPLYPDWRALWKILQDEKVTVFGCSASYIYHLKTIGAQPGKEFNLASLQQISQTGSALSPEGFQYVYEAIKKDLHFNSISGGTDINGCFFAGSPTLPVYAGELQASALGMKVKAYDENGKHVADQQGELVCELASPSMPLYFWNDPNNEKYQNAYFNVYTNPRVWRHGDYIVVHSNTGGITFYGRSDATLKPSGVRIGTTEIYNVVEELEEIVDSLAIGQKWKDDQRIILFVQLAEKHQLTEELKDKIKKELRAKASPRHVPALIFETADIPYTFSGKKVETAITNIIHGHPVKNRDALRNPESLDFFEKIRSELLKDR